MEFLTGKNIYLLVGIGVWVERTDKGNGRAKDKCKGLSAARQTMKLSVTSVEMTNFWVYLRRGMFGMRVRKGAAAGVVIFPRRVDWLCVRGRRL